MSLQEIENLLSKKIGIDVKIIGSRKIAKAVDTRCFVCDIVNVNDYWQLLNTSTQEFNELVELIVVPETWFFRDRQPYEAIAEYIRSQWLNKFKSSNLKSSYQKLRLLSVPCSTGEEPYSLAMTLLNIGLLPQHFHIDAVDISSKSLAKAKKGIYSSNSFRGNNLEFKERYFNPIGKEYQICDYVKNTVNFSQGNLLNSQFLLDRKFYDIIFCRNVLIYFNSSARKIALQSLNRLLKNEGIIVVGASETGELSNHDWEIVRIDGVFVGQKKITNLISHSWDASSVVTPKEITNEKPLLAKIEPRDIPPIDRETASKPNHQVTQNLTQNQNNSHLDIIRDLADQGHLTEAISQCQKYLQADSTNAEAYLLLGEVYQAQGVELKATECFQKAIYLDPKNSQALIHLALIREKQGETAKAAILRQRWQRLQQ
jgi:chemotaxis protein methyltransferase WspC